MIPKAQVEAALKKAGAFWSGHGDDLHEVWITAWMFEIWIPIAGPTGALHPEDLAEILNEIAASKP